MPVFELFVKGEKVVMNEFVSNVIHDVIMAVVTHLRDIKLDEIKRVEIS